MWLFFLLKPFHSDFVRTHIFSILLYIMRKSIPVIIFLVFLVVVPFLTWLNLRKGLDYRLHTKEELRVKDSIDLQLDTLFLFKGKTSIIITRPFDRFLDFTKAIEQIFGTDKAVNVYALDNTSRQSSTVTSFPKNYFSNTLEKYSDKTFILIDTSGYIRNVYNDNNEDIAKLLEHTSVLVPEKKRGSIEFKNR